MRIETIFGPPGTGKTRTLAEIAAQAREPVLFLSFTKAAAIEANSRTGGDVTCSTIHSLAFRQLGLNRQAVVTPKKLAEFGAVAGIPFKGTDGAEEQEEGDDYMAVLSYARNRVMAESEAYDRFGRPGTPARFRMCLNAYEKWKDTYGYVDFDDMLTQATKQHFPTAPIVILDEAQDCSPLQWLVFEEVCERTKKIYVAGDDDQAIYEWSGADPHAMINMAESTRTLEKSWRLPRHVFDFANREIARHIKKRVKKVWVPAQRDGRVQRWGQFDDVPTSTLIDNRHGGKGDTLILCRDNYRLRELQKALHEKKLPYAMATSNGPYENRFAKAIRGWVKEGTPTDEEKTAMLAVLAPSPNLQKMITDGAWAELRKHNWRRSLNIPVRALEFYDTADLFVPLNIKLSTIHQAKGSEADTVVLDLAMTPRVEQGVDLDADAELRVWYVGATRAKHELHLCGENILLK